MAMDEEKILELDQALVAAASKVRVLNALAWPADSETRFLSAWRAGNPRLPKIDLPPRDLGDSIAALEAVSARCDGSDPVEKYLLETAQSYANAARMLGAIGTAEFTRYSVLLYGRPDHVYRTQGLTPADAANHLLQHTEDLLGSGHIPVTDFDIDAGDFADWLQAAVDEFFTPGTVAIRLDPELSAKAIAGSKRIRVRASAVFSALDGQQLLQHEAFVHSATMLNGKRQTRLRALGLGAPRTTRTQEGIAVLAELVTNAIDIERLRRVALRVLAVQQALDGADFIDLFRFFLDAGQSEEESVRSTQRVFRGGAVEGGVVFTKDAVYLSGLLEVHTFLRLAIRENRPELIRNLFAGRMTIADSLRLSPLFASGWLQGPAYVPNWAADMRRLAALIAFSAFVGNIRLDVIDLDRVLALEDEIKGQE